MVTKLTENDSKFLCRELLHAESEREIIRILTRSHLWDDDSAWRAFGDRENNFSIIGNQQSDPAAAMVEKLINSIDAVLMCECYLEGVDPQGPHAPTSIAEALERYFHIKDGNLANVGATQRTELAKNIGFVATGSKHKPNYIVFDIGEGQTPESMPDTLLSLAESNKLRIPFVQGKFNMGGTGVLQFCGEHNFQLMISRRHPVIASKRDPSADYWGFTLIRREKPEGGRRLSMFTYLAPGGTIPRFRSRYIELPQVGNGTQKLPSMEWGTVIKMFEYEMTGLKTIILFDLYYRISLLLARPGLPIRFFERRDYTGHSLEKTMAGLHVRLEEDKRDNLEEGFPTRVEFRIRGERMLASVFAFKRDQAKNYKGQEGIIFTVNGQTHGVIRQSFLNRCSMAYLADSILVIVECDEISYRTHEDLFMNSRDRLRSGDLRSEIENRLQEIIKNHTGLRELRERRRREEIENRLANSRPLRDILNDIIKKSKALSALFLEGTDLKNPFKSRLVGEQEHFEGKTHPTFFRIKKRDEYKKCHINLRFRVQFETDVVNDYFGRDSYPGQFTLYINGQPAEDYVLNLWNGVATLTVTLPPKTNIGDIIQGQTWIQDETLIEPFYDEFVREVEGPVEIHPSTNGKRQLPSGQGEGDRQVPIGLSMPHVEEIREDRWESHNFDKYSSLDVKDAGEGVYDFYVNMNNVFLRTEIKNLSQVDVRLLEARFKFGMVLIGLALLKDNQESENTSVTDTEIETIEERVFEISKSIAPILLPMISELGSLELDTYETSPDLEVSM